MPNADVIVVGLGAMGSAATYQLAKSGATVIGIDRYTPPHTFGSSHGESRISRQAVGEGADYVPLVLRSQELWKEIEGDTGAEIFNACGVLMMRPADAKAAQHGVEDLFATTIEMAESFRISHEVFGSDEVRRRYPQLHVDNDYQAYFEPGGGFVRPENAVAAQLQLAHRKGAALHYDELVLSIAESTDGVFLTTDRDVYSAGQVVVSAGPWISELFPEPKISSLFNVYRQVMHWFPIDEGQVRSFEPEHFPVFSWAFGSSPSDYMYGFPLINGVDGGLKVATGNYVETVAPNNIVRDVTEAETLATYDRCIRGRIPALGSRAIRSSVCMSTVTPDYGFTIDRHPDLEHVLLVSPCSGHGFKHSAAIGEAVAQEALTGRSDIDLNAFSLDRFQKNSEINFP